MNKITDLKYKNSFLASLLIGNTFIISFVLICFMCFFGLTYLYISWVICLLLFLLLLRNTYRRIRMLNIDGMINKRSEIISIALTYTFILISLIYSILCVVYIKHDTYIELIQKYIYIPIAIVVIYIIQFCIIDNFGAKDIRKEAKYILKNVHKKNDNVGQILDDYEKDYSDDDLKLENICNNFIYFTKDGIRFYYNDEIVAYDDMRIKAYYFGNNLIMIQGTKNILINRFISKIYLDGKMLRILMMNNELIEVLKLEKVFTYLCYESVKNNDNKDLDDDQ